MNGTALRMWSESKADFFCLLRRDYLKWKEAEMAVSKADEDDLNRMVGRAKTAERTFMDTLRVDLYRELAIDPDLSEVAVERLENGGGFETFLNTSPWALSDWSPRVFPETGGGV